MRHSVEKVQNVTNHFCSISSRILFKVVFCAIYFVLIDEPCIKHVSRIELSALYVVYIRPLIIQTHYAAFTYIVIVIIIQNSDCIADSFF